MLEIDGSKKSGSGTILRLSIAFAGILKENLHIYNIRKKRKQPGLRPQHLAAVNTAADLCNAEIKGAELNSQELWFFPNYIKGGKIDAEIGTAGSIPMLLLTILPICTNANDDVHIRIIKGGTDVLHSPSINYLKYILLPTLSQMGLKTLLNIRKYGYYPRGMGDVSLDIKACKRLKPFIKKKFGVLKKLEGVSVCTYLDDRKVAERQAFSANKYLRDHELEAKIEVINDKSNPLQKGSSLVIWAKTDTNVIVGGDAIGELRKSSEAVGLEASKNLFKEIKVRATTDIHLADMLVPYIGLAEGYSTYFTRELSEHLETNIWLTKKILGVKFRIKRHKRLYQIEKTS